MLSILSRCPCCEQGASGVTFPLCPDCNAKLHPAPVLCSVCGAARCPATEAGDCLTPWLSQPPIRSYSARYFLTTPAAAVLKRWKTAGGPIFNRRVLNLEGAPGLRERLQKLQLDAIIPTPQRYNRAWLLGGSPAEKIARWLSRELGVPWIPVLRIPSGVKVRQQAELSAEARYAHRIPFVIERRRDSRWRRAVDGSGGIAGRRVLLVDDFLTTGHTLRSAAEILSREGPREIHAFCLGYRPKPL